MRGLISMEKNEAFKKLDKMYLEGEISRQKWIATKNIIANKKYVSEVILEKYIIDEFDLGMGRFEKTYKSGLKQAELNNIAKYGKMGKSCPKTAIIVYIILGLITLPILPLSLFFFVLAFVVKISY